MMMMKIDILPFKSGEREIAIDETYTFTEEEIANCDLLALHDVHVTGVLTNRLDSYDLFCTVTGEMILPCAVTLNPVSYPFSVDIEGDVEELQREIDENYEKVENTIDILPIIWENILMEIPLRVVSADAENAEMQGDGWKLITEHESVRETNPELEKLKDLL